MADEFEKLMKQGFQLMGEGEYQQALTKFDKAIKLDPKNAEAYLAKADAAVCKASTERPGRATGSGMGSHPATRHRRAVTGSGIV